MATKKEIVARNIATMLHDGDFVNLGVGLPAMASNYLSKDITIWFHGENGAIGQKEELPFEWDWNDRDSCISWLEKHGDGDGDWRTGHRDLTNANDAFITLIPGGCCFDTVMSFTMARGGHLDATVLGGLQVDEEGNLANWMVPGKTISGMGGAMDLVAGSKKVIVAMEHCSKDGAPKLLKKCTMPLTGVHCVDVVVTDLCIIEFIKGKPVVTAMAPGTTKESIIAQTEMTLTFSENPATMLIPD
ncbi:MAG: succinyl-CoA--3-ketoacid-CoA transferase [Oscillibacter sp.]|nr:succinyl-CoA--3-ketoacid-CoA transferase [Oscillibacter sp.]